MPPLILCATDTIVPSVVGVGVVGGVPSKKIKIFKI